MLLHSNARDSSEVTRTNERLSTQNSNADDREVYNGFVASALCKSRCCTQLREVRGMRLAKHPFIMSK